MRDELLRELMMILLSEGVDDQSIRSKFIICLNKYEIEKRSTEIAVYEGDSIEKYLQMFLINKRVAGRTDRTLKHYKNSLTDFFSHVNKNPKEVTSDDIKLFLATKDVRNGISKASQRNLLRVISSFYAWMVKEEHILKNPMNKVDEIKVPKVKKKAFTEIELEIMRKNLKNARDKAIFEVLLSTWCRVSEIEGINIKDINSDNSVDVLGKGQKVRRVYLNAKAQVALNDYLNSRTDDNPALFVSLDKPHDRLLTSRIEQFMRELGKKSEVENVHPHRFRRTGATFALRKGMPIEQVSRLLGHESIETTQIYLDLNEEDTMMSHRRYVN